MKRVAHTVVRIEIRSDEAVALGWKQVGTVARQIGLSPVDSTRLLTAIAELARCIVVEGRGGTMIVKKMIDEARQGLEVVFLCHEAAGPDAQACSCCGTCATRSDLGLGDAARLIDDFQIETVAGVGTTITVRKWA